MRLDVYEKLHLYEAQPQFANFLCQVIAHRYEKGSVIFTANKSFKEWSYLFGTDSKLISRTLDRIIHHCEMITIEGSSYQAEGKLTKQFSSHALGAVAAQL